MTCPTVHTYADHQACRYGGAYYHGIIRALWWHWLKNRRPAAPPQEAEGE